MFNVFLSGTSAGPLLFPFFALLNSSCKMEQPTYLKTSRCFQMVSVNVSWGFIPITPQLCLAACNSQIYVCRKEWVPSVLICSLLPLWLLHIISLYFHHKLKMASPSGCFQMNGSEEEDLQGFWVLRTQEHWYSWKMPCVWWMGHIIWMLINTEPQIASIFLHSSADCGRWATLNPASDML